MSTKDKIGTYDFVVEQFHVDFQGHLTLGVLGNHFLNCAGIHAADRGFGMTKIKEENYAWVLSRLAIELDNMPMQGEQFSIRTWVENVYRLFTDRNFALLDKSGKTIGYARSVWAMINMKTRQPANVAGMHAEGIQEYVLPEEACPIEKPSRIKVEATEAVEVTHAKYSDIDINGHFNSIRYIEHILDLFPLDKYTTKSVRRFEISYINESYYGDELHLFSDDLGNDEYAVEIRKGGTEVVCRSKVIFR